jgi:DNA-binding LacI/PurR family transcriptional regulator
MSVTIKDIAMLAGVSHQAVSAALNGNGSSRVSAVNKEKICRIARELNYVPNAIARKFVGGNTKAIGIVSAVYPGWNMHLMGEICLLLTSKGYHTLINHFSGGTSFSPQSTLLELVSRGIDGVIILNSNSRKELRKGLTVPCVFGSHNHLDGYDVAVNNETTGYIGTRHLLAHGHDRVMYLSVMHHPGNERLQGWERAHAERNIAVTPEDAVALRDIGGSFSNLMEIIRARRFRAVFCSNDYIAAKLMKALLTHGVRVPEDIAIMGCDGHSFIEFGPVSLSTVIQPIRPQAEAIVDLMLKRIETRETGSRPADINVEPLLHLGGSCGCRPETEMEELYRINTLGALEKDMMLNFNKNILEDIS